MQVRDCSVQYPHVDLLPFRHGQSARAEDPAGLSAVRPLAAAFDVSQDPFVRHRTDDQRPDPGVEVVVAALDRLRAVCLVAAFVAGEPLDRVVRLCDISVKRGSAVVPGSSHLEPPIGCGSAYPRMTEPQRAELPTRRERMLGWAAEGDERSSRRREWTRK